jgi:hypothetical protein
VVNLKYSYEELVADLEVGHEIEFYFQGKNYSISHNDKGWYFSKYESDDYHTYSDVKNLLENTKILGQTLKEIWRLVEIKSIY